MQEDEEQIENYVNITFENFKFDVLVFSPYLIINKTEQTLYFGERDSKEDNLLCIQPHKIEYFNPGKAKKKSFAVKIDGYDWSQKFDISTVGIAGVCSLKREAKEEIKDNFIKNNNSKLIDFGVLIENLSDPYNKTKTVKFVPRYILVNMSNHPIIVKQMGDDCHKQHWIDHKQSMNYYFENKVLGCRSINFITFIGENFIKIREPIIEEYREHRIYESAQIDKNNWSSRFQIEDINDFQVSIRAEANLGHVLMANVYKQNNMSRSDSLVSNQFVDSKWHSPSQFNNFRRYVKVSITSEDEATIYIVFTQPSMPEFRLNNFTFKKIDFYQASIKGNRRVGRM
jgi:hypothetical protein